RQTFELLRQEGGPNLQGFVRDMIGHPGDNRVGAERVGRVQAETKSAGGEFEFRRWRRRRPPDRDVFFLGVGLAVRIDRAEVARNRAISALVGPTTTKNDRRYDGMSLW